MIRHRLNYNRHNQHFIFLLLSILMQIIALSSAIQHSLAYIQPKGSNISKPLRAWMCSGKSNNQLVDNLAVVSTYVCWLRYVHMMCISSYIKAYVICWLRHEYVHCYIVCFFLYANILMQNL